MHVKLNTTVSREQPPILERLPSFNIRLISMHAIGDPLQQQRNFIQRGWDITVDKVWTSGIKKFLSAAYERIQKIWNWFISIYVNTPSVKKKVTEPTLTPPKPTVPKGKKQTIISTPLPKLTIPISPVSSLTESDLSLLDISRRPSLSESVSSVDSEWQIDGSSILKPRNECNNGSESEPDSDGEEGFNDTFKPKIETKQKEKKQGDD